MLRVRRWPPQSSSLFCLCGRQRINPSAGDHGRDTRLLSAPPPTRKGRRLAHPVLISDKWRPSIPFVRTLRHLWDARSPALSRVCVKWKNVLRDPQLSLLTLRRRAFRLCSNDSSVCRSVTPRRRACGPYGLSFHRSTCCPTGPQVSPRSPGSRA
jgi:hypothetical protein